MEPEVPSTFSIENFSKMPPKTSRPDQNPLNFKVTVHFIFM